jgi:hypothetical protein
MNNSPLDSKIARMQHIIDRQFQDIEREQRRPRWHAPALAFGAIAAGMAFMTSSSWIAKHLF